VSFLFLLFLNQPIFGYYLAKKFHYFHQKLRHALCTKHGGTWTWP